MCHHCTAPSCLCRHMLVTGSYHKRSAAADARELEREIGRERVRATISFVKLVVTEKI